MNLIEKIQQFKEICGLDQYENLTDIDSGTRSTERRAVPKHHRHENETETSIRESETMTMNIERKRRNGGLVEILVQPQSLAGGSLKSYQMESLQWLLNIHQYSEMYQEHFPRSDPNKYQINAILADEMGLGKTIQTLSLLAAVYEHFGIQGTHMLVVPKSTLPQWRQEQEKWCPMFKLQEVVGEATERAEQLRLIQTGDVDIILTTYDVLRLEIRAFQRLDLQYVVMDEGHKLKSQETQIYTCIKSLKTHHKLLLTGTPIQNDMHELWALLNVLMPYVFDSAEQFVQILSEQQNLLLLQEILRLFILRREKKEVERLPPKHEFVISCPMTSLQKKLYKAILLKDQTQLREATIARSGEAARTSLTNIMMQLRKCADHPYLFKGVEPEPQVDGEHIVNVSGKMVLMWALIQKIVSMKEKVLVFCQMTSLLNIIEDYFLFKGITYVRIDGSTDLRERARAMRVFTTQNTSVFLLSTRAGALGLNLTAANHVIIYQQDSNPQVDLQAIGRAYRLLQTKPVFVYRLLTENSVDFRIYERACLKLRLDDVVMKSANFSGREIKQLEKKQAKTALMDAIQFGADQLFTENEQYNDQADYNQPEIVFSQEKLEKLLQAAQEKQQHIQEEAEEKEREFEKLVKNLAADGKLEAADIANMYQFEGVDFKKLTDRLQQEKLRAQIEARRALLERQEAQQQQQKDQDGRDYPTIPKFRFSSFYRPDFFLLDQKFYQLQQKVMDEIQNVIVPAFKGSQLKSYDEYLQQVADDKSKAPLYTDRYLPGLTAEEVTEYYEFLDLQCPALGNQYMTRKEYSLIIQSVTDLDPEEKPLKFGLRRIAFGDEMKTVSKSLGFSKDENLQDKYSFGILPPSKDYSISMAKKFDLDEILNFKHAFSVYNSYQPDLVLTEEIFVNYCVEHSKVDDKLQKILARKKAALEKYNTVFQLVDIENPMKNMLLVRPNQAKKTFKPIHDKFLICWVSMFGFNEYRQCVYFINVTPRFRSDYWFRLRDHDELKERVDKLIKLNMRTQIKIENE